MRFVNSATTGLFLVIGLAPALVWSQTTASPAIDSSIVEKFGLSEPESAPSPVTESGNQQPTGLAEEGIAEEGNGYTESGEELIYLNATDVEIKDMIKQISKATGTNFLIEEKLRGKITIISEKPMTKEMAYQAFLSALQVMGYTTVETPAGLIKIVPTKQALSEPIDLYKSDHPNTDRFITRIIQVANISANDLSTVIKPLVSKDGNLFAYPQTNSLIITDSGANIERVLRIVKELDHEGPQEVIEIIPIKHADAADITEKVLSLYESQIGSAAGANQARGRQVRRGGPELEESPSISKVISDERTNSLIVLGDKRSIIKLRGLIDRLDTPTDGTEGSIHVYYLKHANAKEMAEVLSSLVSGAKPDKNKKGAAKTPTAQPARPAAAAKDEAVGAVQLSGDVKVTADESTNSLVITASPKDFQILITQVINKLDIPRRQVYLEAVVMELRVEKNRSLGLAGNFGNILNLGGNKLSAFGALLPLAPQVLSGLATGAGGLAAGGFSERSIDLALGDGTTASIPAVSAILHALQTDTNVNVLSTPSILTLDNEEAQIQVGNEIGIPSGTTISAAGTSLSVTREDTGIILKVTPQISESDTVRLKLAQEITNVIPGGATDQQLGPTLTKRAVTTVVVAHDKQTIVIGGLLEDNSNVTTHKIPLLGDVPIVGNLFKNRSTRMNKTNILVFITPYVIRDRSDYLGILQKKIEERNLFIDLNYGFGDRKKIRKALREHASHLLQYQPSIYPGSVTTPYQEVVAGAPPSDEPPKVIESTEKKVEVPEKKDGGSAQKNPSPNPPK